MDFLHFFSLKRLLVAISFALVVALLLPLLRSCGCYSYSFSSTLLVLVLPTSFSFVISKIKQLVMARSMEEPTSESKIDLNLLAEEEIDEENKPAKEESDELRTDEIVPSGECPSMDDDNCSVYGENLEKLRCSALENSDCSVSEDELASSEIAGSDNLISDDESLIEIALDDEFQQDLKGGLLPEFLPEFLPEMKFRKHGLMELLSETNEEDNMIEIDITMGSIKCSRFEIEA